MNIISHPKPQPPTVHLHAIPQGEAFRCPNGFQTYMRIEPKAGNIAGLTISATKLDDGQVYELDKCKSVVPVEAEIKILGEG